MTSPTERMTGKTCLITQAASRIGLATVTELARLGAEVVGVVCDARAADKVAAAVRESAPAARVSTVVADLASQAEVRRLANDLTATHPRLDVLINNSSIACRRRRESPEGIELTWATDYLAPVLLTRLLMDVCRACAPMRILNVVSALPPRASLTFDPTDEARRFHGPEQRTQAHLAVVMFTYELARRLEGSGVTANAVYPGATDDTPLGRAEGRPPQLPARPAGEGALAWLSRRLSRSAASSPAQAAGCIVALASRPEFAGVSGKYFVRTTPCEDDAPPYDEAVARRMWQQSADLTGLPVFP